MPVAPKPRVDYAVLDTWIQCIRSHAAAQEMLQRGTGERNRDALVMLLAGIAGSSDRVVIVGNAYLDRFLVQLEHAVRHFGKTSYAYAGWPPRSLEEHRAII